MAPPIVVASDFLAQEGPGPADVVGVVSNAGADQAILKPLIRPLDLALGLGGQGVGDLDAAVPEDPFPLRIDLVGELAMVSPGRITALDEAEDRVRVDIVAQGKAVGAEDRLQGLDMRPRAFSTDKFGIEDEPGVVVDRGDQVPLFAGGGSPEVEGRVVLNELAGVLGQDRAVVDRALGPFEVGPVVLGAVDDRREGDLLAVVVFEGVLAVAVVVGPDGDGLVLDELLAGSEFLEAMEFGLLGDGA